jgi:uncharacterized membrane protein YkoI
MQRKQTFIGTLLLSLALFPCVAMAELNDGSLSPTSESAAVHRETNMESDQRFFAAFRAAPLSLSQAIAIAERSHAGSRTAAISFDRADDPVYRVTTVKEEEIWENVVNVHTGRTVEPETSRSLNELEREERDTINALRAVKQELSDAVAIAEKAAAGKAISGALVKEGDQLNFVVVVLSEDHVKEVFLEPPRATSKRQPAKARKNRSGIRNQSVIERVALPHAESHRILRTTASALAAGEKGMSLIGGHGTSFPCPSCTPQQFSYLSQSPSA